MNTFDPREPFNQCFMPGSQPVGGHNLQDVCFCTGPQNGEPLCPCRMKNVKIIDGEIYEKVGDANVQKNRNS